MFHKIIATMLSLSLVSSLTFAQEMPGTAAPVVPESSEETLILNSAPLEEKASISLSDITVTTELDEAVLSFSTNISVHAVIEYGLTAEYDHSISTEPQKIHTETLGDLQECRTYYYQVRVSDISSPGEFKTRCPAVKKVVKKTTPTKKIEQKQKMGEEIEQKQSSTLSPQTEGKIETGIDLNSELGHRLGGLTPSGSDSKKTRNSELILNAAPEIMKNEEGRMKNEVAETEIVEVPKSPVLPGPIAFGNDTLTDKADADNVAPAGLLLFALLSGMVLALFAFRKQKKWYQK